MFSKISPAIPNIGTLDYECNEECKGGVGDEFVRMDNRKQIDDNQAQHGIKNTNASNKGHFFVCDDQAVVGNGYDTKEHTPNGELVYDLGCEATFFGDVQKMVQKIQTDGFRNYKKNNRDNQMNVEQKRKDLGNFMTVALSKCKIKKSLRNESH